MTTETNGSPAPRQLYELREWLMDRIDGGEEMRGEDGLISDFIRQIDALPSEIAEPKGCPTPGACSAVAEQTRLRQMAEHERDSMLEKLRAATSMPCASSATAAPVAWMYEESGERMFGHPDGYRPKDAVPLYAGSPPVEEGAIRDAARYRWLRNVGDETWEPFCKRAVPVEQIDRNIDAAIDRYRDAGEQP